MRTLGKGTWSREQAVCRRPHRMQGRAPGIGFGPSTAWTLWEMCLGSSPPRGMLRSAASQVSSAVPGGSAPHPEDLPSCSWSREVRHTAPRGRQSHSKRHSSTFKKVMFRAKPFKKLKHWRDLGSVKWGAVSSLGVKIWYLGQKRSQFSSKKRQKRGCIFGTLHWKRP